MVSTVPLLSILESNCMFGCEIVITARKHSILYYFVNYNICIFRTLNIITFITFIFNCALYYIVVKLIIKSNKPPPFVTFYTSALDISKLYQLVLITLSPAVCGV